MRVFPQGKFWGGFVGKNISTRHTWFEAFASFTGNSNYDPYAALINSYSLGLIVQTGISSTCSSA